MNIRNFSNITSLNLFCHKIGFPAIPPFVADFYDFRFVCEDFCEMTYLFMGIDAEKYGDDGIGFGKKL